MKFSNWIKSHKKQIFLYGSLALIVVGGAVLLRTSNESTWQITEISKSRKSDQIILNSAKTIISPATKAHTISTEPAKIIDIEPYLRNLPKGYHVSADKISTALEHGFNLNENQTWVDKHTRTYTA